MWLDTQFRANLPRLPEELRRGFIEAILQDYQDSRVHGKPMHINIMNTQEGAPAVGYCALSEAADGAHIMFMSATSNGLNQDINELQSMFQSMFKSRLQSQVLLPLMQRQGRAPRTPSHWAPNFPMASVDVRRPCLSMPSASVDIGRPSLSMPSASGGICRGMGINSSDLPKWLAIQFGAHFGNVPEEFRNGFIEAIVREYKRSPASGKPVKMNIMSIQEGAPAAGYCAVWDESDGAHVILMSATANGLQRDLNSLNELSEGTLESQVLLPVTQRPWRLFPF